MIAKTAARAVMVASLAALAVWLFWYGHYSWAYSCQRFRAAIPMGSPAGYIQDRGCALAPGSPVLGANLGFFIVAPAVAALAALALIALKQRQVAAAMAGAGVAHQTPAASAWQYYSTLSLPPQSFWAKWTDGLTVRDLILFAAWAAYNAAWMATIAHKYASKLPLPLKLEPPPKLVAKMLAALATPNIMLLLFPVSRGSVLNQALGLTYNEAIRFHRLLGQWVLLLISLHGLMYWFSWVEEGKWLHSFRTQAPDTNNLMGSIGLLFALLLLISSQEFVRRRAYAVFKKLHFVGFWGFMVCGVAHHWTLFWSFLPGMCLYAVDGVFRLHQALVARGVDAREGGSGDDAKRSRSGGGVATTELLAASVDRKGGSCVLVLAVPEGFGAPAAGAVWLNAPSLAPTQWHPFDCTSVKLAVTRGDSTPRMALMVNLKAYAGWTKKLVKAVDEQGRQLKIRMQGPYADPVLSHAHAIDALVVIAGGNGIAAVLAAFQELAAAGINTCGLPTLCVWTTRHGHEMTFTGPRFMAAARALGLDMETHLYCTAGKSLLAAAASPAPAPADAAAAADTDAVKDATSKQQHVTLAVAADGSPDGSADGSAATTATSALPHFVPVIDATPEEAVATANSLCPVVAFSSYAGQLSFRAVIHLAVFGGALAGIFLARYIAGLRPMAAGQVPWHTRDLGLLLVGLTTVCSLAAGLVTLSAGLLLRATLAARHSTTQAGAKAAAGAAAGKPGRHVLPSAAVLPLVGVCGRLEPAPKGAAAPLQLLLPTAAGGPEDAHPVSTGRPNVEALLGAWLAGLQQLPAATTKGASACAQRLHVTVLAGGPTPLIHSTQALVQAVNAKQRSKPAEGAGSRSVRLHFVRKTQAL